MARWTEHYPAAVIKCQYESTVADVENMAKSLCEFIGIDFEEQMLDFYKSKRLVRTPSASQVRQPIYSSSVAAWKRYEEQLKPLALALEENR